MTGFTKLFGDIIMSTIWQEDDKTRLVWITLLAIADRIGEVSASVPGLADAARVSQEECKRALVKLGSPDLDSRTKDNEGRRIMEIDGGWRILNYLKYRQKGRYEERREYLRQKQAEYRQGKKVPPSDKIAFSFEKMAFENIPPADIELWRGAYPAIDIELGIKQAAAWLTANPTKRKNNYKRFLVNWFKRTQDQGGNRRKQNNRQQEGQTTEEIKADAIKVFERIDNAE